MLISFYHQFVSPIIKDLKIHSMRNIPKRMPKVGETLYMYTGPYNEKRKLVRKDKIITSIQKIEIRFKWMLLQHEPHITIDGKLLSWLKHTEFYVNDGFIGEKDFLKYWHKKLKKHKGNDVFFDGILINWTDHKY